MLAASQIAAGDRLEILDAMRPADGADGLSRVCMYVGSVEGELSGREVGLMRGDVLFVVLKPRKVKGRLICRVRRALSQSVGEVRWSDLRAAAVKAAC